MKQTKQNAQKNKQDDEKSNNNVLKLPKRPPYRNKDKSFVLVNRSINKKTPDRQQESEVAQISKDNIPITRKNSRNSSRTRWNKNGGIYTSLCHQFWWVGNLKSLFFYMKENGK